MFSSRSKVHILYETIYYYKGTKMPIDSKKVACGDCGLQLEEDCGQLSENRLPCPACGSMRRVFQVTIRATVTFKKKLGIKGRHAGGGKPFIEQGHGDDLHRGTGKWMKKSRIINRENGLYKELVTDPETGDVVHECEEPLSQHVGHGDAGGKKENEE